MRTLTALYRRFPRYWYLLVLLLLQAGSVCAQSNITRVEYYVDNDPGFGNATALSITPGTNIQDAVISLNPAIITEGVHRLYVRACNAVGNWSPVNAWLFYKPYSATGAPPTPVTPNINQLEYYIDSDPGAGQATPVAIAPGTNIQDAIIALNPASVIEGVHRLYVRARTTGGAWSMVNALLFYKPYGATGVPPLSPAASINRIEYYIDTDPGFGNATALSIVPGTDLADVVIPIDPATVSAGVHRLYVRARNADGKWSLANTWLFYKAYVTGTVPPEQPRPNITRIEYYVDNDPGLGKATALTTTPTTDVLDAVIAIDPASLNEGVHRLYVRTQDANRNWSLINTWLFYKPYNGGTVPPLPATANIQRIEYYMDTDPGKGKGTAVPFTAGTSVIDQSFTADISTLPQGSHTLYLRALNAAGKWSMLNTKTFTVGNFAAALSFDGINDYISIPHNSLLKPAAQITLEAWIKPADVHTNRYYEIYRKEDVNARHLLSFQEFGTVLSFGLTIANTYTELDVPITAANYEGQWVHIAATFDGTVKRLYRNGVLIGSENISGPINTAGTAPAYIGSFGGSGEFFNGSLDEFRLWSRALPPCEIQGRLHCEMNERPNDLVLYYQCNQGIALQANPGTNTLVDSSRNHFNGALTNFALTGAVSNWVSAGAVIPGMSCTFGPPATETTNLTGCNRVEYKGTAYTASIVLKDTLRTAFGCDSLYRVVNITVTIDHTIEQTIPVLTATGRLLQASAAAGFTTYQWYRNGNVIAGITGNSYQATADGAYTVVFTSNCGISPQSNAISFGAVGQPQTITFPVIPPQQFGNYITLPATASSGLPVIYKVLSGPARIGGDTLFITGVGTITVEAAQPGDAAYEPATSLTQSFTVARGAQTIRFDSIPNTSYGSEAISLQAQASTGLPVYYTVVAGFASITGNTLRPTGAGAVTVRAVQNGNQQYESIFAERTFCILPVAPAIINGFKQPCLQTQVTYSVSAVAGITYAWSLSGGGTLSAATGNNVTVTWNALGAQTLTVRATTGCDTAAPATMASILVTDAVTPGAATNLFPAPGTVLPSLPFTLSWMPAQDAELYDVFIWKEADTEPAVPVVSGLSQIGFSVGTGNLPGFAPGTRYKWKVVSRNACRQSASVVQTFAVSSIPNLLVENVQTPVTAFSGQTIDLSYTVRNAGNAATGTAQWIDYVYLSKDTILHVQSGDYFLGSVNNLAALQAGESYNGHLTVKLPEEMIGTCYVLVVSNGFNRALSPNAPGSTFTETTLDDNLGYRSFEVSLTPPPDLQVTAVTTAGEAFSGKNIPVQYTVVNRGEGAAKNAFWKDYFYISPDPVLDTTAALKIGEYQHLGSLAPDSIYQVSTNVTLPNNIFGYYYLFVRTNGANQVYEFTFSNNNSRRSDSLNIFLTPPADFVVTEINAPATAVKGEKFAISWTVLNEGSNKPADNEKQAWADAVYISKDPVFNSNARLLGVNAPWYQDFSSGTCGLVGPSGGGSPCPFVYPKMLPNGTYGGSASIIIPADFDGPAYLYVWTDAGGKVFEYTGEDNNVKRATIFINRPDLIATELTVPATAASGSNINIGYKIRNNGPGKVLYDISRRDLVGLSPTPEYNPATFLVLQEYYMSAALEANAATAWTRTVKIPEGLSGTYYVMVKANNRKDVFETDTTNNTAVSAAMAISLTPSPDFEVTIFTLGSDIVSAEQKMPIQYQVINKGVAAIVGRSWTDRIFLSKQPLWDRNAAIKVKDISRVQALQPGDSYTVNDSLVFTPQMLTALQAYATPCYLYVFTDADSVIYEHQAESNNRLRSDALVAIQQWPPDFAVTTLSGPSTVRSGDKGTVSWSVTNFSGTTENYGGLWYDGIYFSKDTIWDHSDVFVTDKVIYGPLVKNASYSSKLDFFVPDSLSGPYYLLLVADHKDLQKDQVPGNNYRRLPVQVTLAPPADLVVDSLSTPSQATAGQPVTITYRVRNNGTGITGKGHWTDRIYLSRTTQMGAAAESLLSVSRNDSLAAGADYLVTAQVFIPAKAAGNYYLVVRTDENNAVYEHNGEQNNTTGSFIYIVQPPPADLVVSVVTVPAQAIMGDSLQVSWTLSNQGDNPAQGYFREGVYLSADSAWDISDALLGDPAASILLAPGASLNHTKKFKVKGGITPGNYFVLVRTDLTNNIVESNETNNDTASVAKLNIDVRNLPLNITTAATLEVNDELYYKVQVPDSLQNEAFLVSLQSDSARGANELYISYGKLPTRIQYDYAFDKAFSNNQEVVIPAASAGTYYILAYGTIASQNRQPVKLTAKKINFELRTITANEGGNTGSVTVKISGAKFEKGMQVKLVDAALGNITAHTVYFTSSTALYASFNLSGAKTGAYDVVITKSGGATASLPDGFTVVPGSGGSAAGSGSSNPGFYCTIKNIGVEEMLGVNIEYPSSTRTRRVFPMTINFGNSGNVDIQVPTRIFVSLSGDPLSFTAEGVADKKQELYIEFKELNGPPGILRPGATGSITVYTQSVTGKNLIFRLVE